MSTDQRIRHQRAVRLQREERLLATAKPNPARITAALDAAGLWGPEVDRACGVEEPTVDLWEAGELVPTPDQVRALAKLCGVTPTMFYGEHKPVPMWLCGSDGCEYIDPLPGAEKASPVPACDEQMALADVIPLRRRRGVDGDAPNG